MATDELNARQKAITDFRFGIIADLVYSNARGKDLAVLIAAKAARTYEIPFSRKTRITSSCIRKWLEAHSLGARDALVPKIRKDKGTSRSITDADKERILKLLEQKPLMDASSAVRTLIRESRITGDISKSSLSRFIRSSGFDRASRTRALTKDQVQRFSYEYPLECVQIDDMHSFLVSDHTGRLRKAILIAFLDDATRRVLYARFSFTENALEFERGILHILRSHGRPHRFYADNGAPFVSEQTKRILATLGIPLIHSRPGIPKGRGKIERFFRTVRIQFEITLDPSSIRSIQDYDMRFRTWLESEYHRQPHSSLAGRTPLDAYLAGTSRIFRVDPTIDLDDVFCHEAERTVANDGTVSIHGVHHEIPTFLIGTKVKLRWNPQADLPSVFVHKDGKRYGPALRSGATAGCAFQCAVKADHGAGRPGPSSVPRREASEMAGHLADMLSYFSMAADPFARDLDPSRVLRLPGIEESLSSLSFFCERQGIAILAGKSGSGKSCLLRLLASSLPEGLYKPVYIGHATVSLPEFYGHLAAAFTLQPQGRRAALFRAVQDHVLALHRSNKVHPALIIDKAHCLSNDILVELRHLLNFQYDSETCMSILLCGQEDLLSRLKLAILESLANSVTTTVIMKPLTPDETASYLEERLKHVGARPDLFNPPAVRSLHTSKSAWPT